MMSEDRNQEIQEMRASRILLEEFFDRHEFPEELYKEEVYTINKISIYKVSDETDRFLLEFQFTNWKKAAFGYKQLCRLFGDADKVAIFRIGKKLFLRKFLF